MANFHLYAKPFIDKLEPSRSIIVEIGSERGEGSTAWFDTVAKELNKDFYSVDVTDYASTTLTHLENTNFIDGGFDNSFYQINKEK